MLTMTPPLVVMAGSTGAAHREQPPAVGVDDGVPVLVGAAQDGLLDLDAGVVNQQRHGSEVVRRLVHDPLRRTRGGDVGLDPADVSGHVGWACATPAGHHAVTVVEQADDDGATDASASTGDDGAVGRHDQGLICWTWAERPPSRTQS